MTWLYVCLSIIIGYLFGSINVSVILSKYFFKGDVRNFGSGNAGATNIASLIALLIAPAEYTEVCTLAVGIACSLGHAYPVFFGFKGGKGVTVGAAIALLIDWKALLFILAVFIITFIFTRIVSISSIMGALGLIFITTVFYVLNLCQIGGGYFANFTPEKMFLAFIAGLFVVWLHKPNILRLLKGEEKKFTFKKKN